MKNSITRTEAKAIWDKYLKTEYLRLHTLESEAIMRKLAKHLGKDEEYWGITGLIHDLDMDIINGDYQQHAYKTVEILKEEGFDLHEMFEAIIAHVEGLSAGNAHRKTDFEFALAAAENITGIISAYVAIKPDKKIAGTKVSSINKKLKTPAFAASVNREFIYDIEKAGIGVDQFIEISIDAMTGIADETGM